MIDKVRNDLNQALKNGDKQVVSVLRGIIAVIQNAEIAKRTPLTDEEIINVLQKESKKRLEAAELYDKAGSAERKTAELEEKIIIDRYLPEQLSDDDLEELVDQVISELQPNSMADMGKVIGKAKEAAGSQADGSRIAQVVKRKLSEA